MARTVESLVYVVFALVGAALLIYFVIHALPDIKPESVDTDDDRRGLFGTCDNETRICARDVNGVNEIEKKRCEVLLADILCHQSCPCP